MLKTLENCMIRIESVMRRTRSGKLDRVRGHEEFGRAVDRLWEKLELTSGVEAALKAIQETGELYFSGEIFCHPRERQRVYRILRAAAERLRLVLETAHIAFLDRNEVQIFSERTLKNLDYIQAQRSLHHADVHLVTMLTGSLLGLIVFVRERHLHHHVAALDLGGLAAQRGFPTWEFSLGEEQSRTLGGLIERLRNAVAHGRIYFASDSPNLEDVVLEFEDAYCGHNLPHWRASINAADLLTFCRKFAVLIDDYLR